MRSMVVFVLVLTAVVATLALCAPLRLRVEHALFQKQAAPAAAEAPQAPAPSAGAGLQQLAGGIRGLVDKAAERIAPAGQTASAQAPPPPATDAASAADAQTLASDETGPVAALLGGGPSAHTPAQNGEVQPWQRLMLPPGLHQVRFGMTAEQISRGYPVAWTKEEFGSLMLVHYPVPDRSQTLRFHFSGDSLYRIEARFAPTREQTRKELYDVLQQHYAQLYAQVPEKSETRWSDGTVSAQIQLTRDGVELVFTCRAARR